MANKLAGIKLYVTTSGEVVVTSHIPPPLTPPFPMPTWPVLACTGLYWPVLAYTGLYWPVTAFNGWYCTGLARPRECYASLTLLG